MALSMSDNELYASVKAEGRRFFCSRRECWSLMMHGPSSRKRCFVLEGESKVLGVQAAAFRKGHPGTTGEGTEGTRRTHREPNTAELVEPCCRGLEEGLPVKAG